MNRAHLAALCLLVAASASCRKTPSYGPSEAQVKSERLGKLRNEILTMTTPRGCKAAGECKAAGVGYNRCGGPRQYIVYCGKGVDESSLSSKREELEKLEEDEAKKQGEPPPCKKASEPQVEFADGACRAKL